MKKRQKIFCGFLTLIIALAFFACDNGNNDTHTHDYGTAWKSNATQHWRECSCGDKTDIANHTGDPCDICGYASGSQNPDLCECNGIAEDCDCEDCDCETCTVTANVNVAAVPFTAGTELKFKIDGGASNNYSFVGGTADGFVTADLNGITYTLSSVNPVKDLSAYNNGNIPSSVFAIMEYPTITQTFYYNGQLNPIGSRSVVAVKDGSVFSELYDVKALDDVDNAHLYTINAIPATTLNISKEISANTPLAAHAQAAPTHTLANNLTITLNGTGSAGNITAYAWECVSYTADQGTVSAVYSKAQVDALIANANTATATVAPRKAGTYVFKLTVTGNDSESDTDTVTVVVEKGILTKNVNVTFPAFAENPTVIDLNPIYNGITSGDLGDGFNTSSIRFEIKDNKGHDFTTLGSINLIRDKSIYGLEWPWPAPLFTQTFYDNAGNTLGEYSFYAADLDEVGYFEQIFIESENDSIVISGEELEGCRALTSLPPAPMILKLSRTVTELP